MLSLRHSIGIRPPLATLIRGSKSVPDSRCYASPPPTEICALCKLDFAVLSTTDDIGFITSDHPCVWHDPEGYKRPPMYQSPGLIYETIQITLPISPEQCIFLNRQGITPHS